MLELWRNAIPDSGPVAAYLAAHGAWLPGTPLPTTVRFLPSGDLRGRQGWPAEAAGAAVYAWDDPETMNLTGVQLEPLTADGGRIRWRDGPSRKSLGRIRGKVFMAAHNVSFDRKSPLHVVAGPVDALAVRYWRNVETWAAGDTALFEPLARLLAGTGRPIVIEANGEPAGRKAAAELEVNLCTLGASVRLIGWPEGCDPAAGLAGDWAERAAIIEANGIARRDAERQAWSQVRPAAPKPESGAGQ